MGGRWFKLGVVMFWLISMSWLFTAKVLPWLYRGDPPPSTSVSSQIADKPDEPIVECWRIDLDGKPVGWVVMRITRQNTGTAAETIEVESLAHFERLPITQIASKLSSALGTLMKPIFKGEHNPKICVVATNHTTFDPQGQLLKFQSGMQLGQANIGHQLRMVGTVNRAGRLQLVTSAKLPKDPLHQSVWQEVDRREVALPKGAVVSDAFSPQSRLSKLYVGQTWTFPAYRFTLWGNPVQIIKATVKNEENISWNGDSVRTFHVVQRRGGGLGISLTREPVGQLWVQPDGTVLQQKFRVANLRFTFVRLADNEQDEKVEQLKQTVRNRPE